MQSREKIVTGSQQNINSLFEQISFVNKELDDLTKKNTENYVNELKDKNEDNDKSS